MTDAEAAPPTQPWLERLRSMFTPKASGGEPVSDGEVGRRMRTLDVLERKWGFGLSALPFVFALVLLPSLLHNTVGYTPVAKVKGKCPYPLIMKVCELKTIYHPADFAVRFALLVLFGGVLLFAVWRSLRTLVVVMSFFCGFVVGTIGLALFFYGGWLLVRSWRLQRYGTVNGKEVRKIAVDRAEEKRAAKKAGPEAVSPTGKSAPTPSKRYTPKTKPRGR